MFLQFMAQHSVPFGLSTLIKCLILLRKRNEKWWSNVSCFHVVVKYRKGGSLKLYDTGIQFSFSFKVFPALLFPFYSASDFAKSYRSAQLHI